jgi:IstB-like ATP binding protein
METLEELVQECVQSVQRMAEEPPALGQISLSGSRLIVATNLPFSQWSQVAPNPRPCKALLDRITDRAYVIQIGTESYPSAAPLRKLQGRTPEPNITAAPPSGQLNTQVNRTP